MAQKAVVPLTEGKAWYLSKDDNIISKKQAAYDAKNEEESLSGTFSQTGYGMDFFTTAYAEGSMDAYSASRFIWHKEGFIRGGYVDRYYGRIYPEETPTLPKEPYQAITPKTSPQLRMEDDLTGTEILKLSAKIEYEYGRGSAGFIDLDSYYRFVQLHASRIGAALGRQVQVASSLYAMSHYPCSTLTSDVNIVPFLEQTVRPDQGTSPGAYKWFDKSGYFWKFMLKHVFGQAQKKHTNIGYYSVKAIGSTHDKVELTRPTAPTVGASDTKTANIFTQKTNNKFYTHNSITPFACLYALSRAIKSKWISMTQIEDPKNMGCYQPYKTSAQTAIQFARRVSPERLEIILNPYDYAMLTEGIRNTSPDGNYTATIQSLIAAGTQVFAKDTMLPGHFIIQEIGTYMFIKILQQNFRQNFDYCLARQDGAHMFGRLCIRGYTLFYKGIPDNGIAGPEYMYNNFKGLEAKA